MLQDQHLTLQQTNENITLKGIYLVAFVILFSQKEKEKKKGQTFN